MNLYNKLMYRSNEFSSFLKNNEGRILVASEYVI